MMKWYWDESAIAIIIQLSLYVTISNQLNSDHKSLYDAYARIDTGIWYLIQNTLY